MRSTAVFKDEKALFEIKGLFTLLQASIQFSISYSPGHAATKMWKRIEKERKLILHPRDGKKASFILCAVIVRQKIDRLKRHSLHYICSQEHCILGVLYTVCNQNSFQ